MYLDFDFHSPSRRLALLRMVDGASEILLLDVESGDSLGRIGPELFPSDPRFSPDGGRLSFFGDGRIYVHSLERGASDAVVDLTGRYAAMASWSPDGRSLAFSAFSSPAEHTGWPRILRLDLADRRMVQLSDEPGIDRFPDWRAAGGSMAFRRTLVDFPKYYHTMMITDRDGAATRPVPLPDGISQLTSRHCWSPDGAFLVVWEGDVWEGGRGALHRRLKAFRVDDMSVAWTLEGETLLGGCFDPSGEKVLAAAEDRLTLYAFPSGEPLDELSLEDLAPLHHISTRVSVAFDPERDSVYFLGRDGKLYRWRIGGSCEVAHEDRPEELTIQLRSEEYSFTSRNGRDVPVRRYLPRAPNGHAVLVEGGPWSGHDPHNALLLRMLEEGYEVIRPAYRATGPNPGGGWPLQPGVFGRDDVQDVVDCAVDWKAALRRRDRLAGPRGRRIPQRVPGLSRADLPGGSVVVRRDRVGADDHGAAPRDRGDAPGPHRTPGGDAAALPGRAGGEDAVPIADAARRPRRRCAARGRRGDPGERAPLRLQVRSGRL